MYQHLPRLYLAVSRSPGGEQKRPVAPSGRSFPGQRPQRVAPPLFGTGPARSTSHAVTDSGPARNEPLLLAPVLSSASATSIASSVGLRRVPWLPLAQNRPGPVREPPEPVACAWQQNAPGTTSGLSP